MRRKESGKTAGGPEEGGNQGEEEGEMEGGLESRDADQRVRAWGSPPRPSGPPSSSAFRADQRAETGTPRGRGGVEDGSREDGRREARRGEKRTEHAESRPTLSAEAGGEQGRTGEPGETSARAGKLAHASTQRRPPTPRHSPSAPAPLIPPSPLGFQASPQRSTTYTGGERRTHNGQTGN